MTANQIAYYGAREQERHNKISEELEAQRIDNENTWHNTQNRINEEYNKLSLELQEAQGNRRNEIQAQLADLEQEKFNFEQVYRDRDLGIKNKQMQADVDYKHALAVQGYSKNEIDAFGKYLEWERNQYTKYYNENMVRIQDYNALANMRDVNNRYQLGLLQNQLGLLTNQLSFQEYQSRDKVNQSVVKLNEAQTDLAKVKQSTEYINSIGQGFRNLISPLLTIPGLF